MRSSTADITTQLVRPLEFSLEEALDLITEDELIEITPDNLSDWQQQKSTEISQYLHKMLITNCALFECQNRMENFSNVIFEQEINELILTAASQAFQEVDIININITKLELPDIEVYQQSRDLYFQLLDQQMQSRLKAVKDMSIERESNSIMYQKPYFRYMINALLHQ